MDELSKKVDDLLKSLLSIKTGASKDLMVPAIKPLTNNLPKPSIKQPSAAKIPSGLPPPSKKDPAKVAEQLKNPRPGKVNVEILKIEDNGQWSLKKNTDATPVTGPREDVQLQTSKAPIHAEKEGFVNHHGPEQKKLIHGLDMYNMSRLRGGQAGGGTYKADVPGSKNGAIVKQASAHADQAERGHLHNGFNSAKREVLFHNMAHDFFGMGKHVPTTAGFSRGGEDYSAQAFQEGAHHPDLKENDLEVSAENPFEAKRAKDEFKHPQDAKTLKNLHESGDLHKLALMDNIMGHHDRHSGNMMLGEGGDKLHLIDNGTAFDYDNFDTKHYPAYLRHSGNENIKGMGLDHSKLNPEAVKWLNKLDPQKAKEMMAAHGHDEQSPTTQGMLRRLQGMKNAVNNGPEHYKSVNNLLDKNRLTSGPLKVHTPGGPKW